MQALQLRDYEAEYLSASRLLAVVLYGVLHKASREGLSMAKQTKGTSVSKKNPKGMSITQARKEHILDLAEALAQMP